jgi:hypothetical protein
MVLVLFLDGGADLNVAPSAITTFLVGFIEDFNNLDWPSFRARFRDDATIFFPQQYQVRRAAGRVDTDAAWDAVFGSIRAASGKTGPPFMHLRPQEIVVQELAGSAIATCRAALMARSGAEVWSSQKPPMAGRSYICTVRPPRLWPIPKIGRQSAILSLCR